MTEYDIMKINMEKNQTAVRWLQEALSLHLSDEQKVQFEGLFQQAVEVEKDQIIDAHDAAYIAMNLAFRGFDRSVEYYEKTYGAQNNGKPEQLP
jgi:aminoglycoside phosphotransferase family enzyme